jgi:hypothetical protein
MQKKLVLGKGVRLFLSGIGEYHSVQPHIGDKLEGRASCGLLHPLSKFVSDHCLDETRKGQLEKSQVRREHWCQNSEFSSYDPSVVVVRIASFLAIGCL